jgi:hypothetical protein
MVIHKIIHNLGINVLEECFRRVRAYISRLTVPYPELATYEAGLR